MVTYVSISNVNSLITSDEEHKWHWQQISNFFILKKRSNIGEELSWNNYQFNVLNTTYIYRNCINYNCILVFSVKMNLKYVLVTVVWLQQHISASKEVENNANTHNYKDRYFPYICIGFQFTFICWYVSPLLLPYLFCFIVIGTWMA